MVHASGCTAQRSRQASRRQQSSTIRPYKKTKRDKLWPEYWPIRRLGTARCEGLRDRTFLRIEAHVATRFASAIVLRIGFGVKVESDNDEYLQIATDANLATSKGGNPGTTLVDYFPLCTSCPPIWYTPRVILTNDHRPIRSKLSKFLSDVAACACLALGYQTTP